MPQLLRLKEVEALFFFQGKWLDKLPSSFALSTNQEIKAIILFHGYGANAWDLSSLAEFRYQSSHKSEELWIFPQGFLNLSGGFGDFGQCAWFPISVERLMLQKVSSPDFLSHQTIDSATQIFTKLSHFVDELSQLGVREIVLGGFSQGGMIAYHLLPLIDKKEVSVETLALFSTVSIDFNHYHPLWQKNIPFQSLKHLIQSHGKSDEVLSFSEGKKLFSFLSPYFRQSEFCEFSGGHALPENALLTFFRFI
jgi:phospholipase/carboxylesterase